MPLSVGVDYRATQATNELPAQIRSLGLRQASKSHVRLHVTCAQFSPFSLGLGLGCHGKHAAQMAETRLLSSKRPGRGPEVLPQSRIAARCTRLEEPGRALTAPCPFSPRASWSWVCVGACASSKWPGNAKLRLLVVHMEGHRETGHRDGRRRWGKRRKRWFQRQGL